MNWLSGRIIENRPWTETLFSLRVEGAASQFRAGQFVRIALDIDGQRVARAFSFVNPPQDPVLEFYGVIVPQGPLSPRLARLAAGDTLHVASLLGSRRAGPAARLGRSGNPSAHSKLNHRVCKDKRSA